MNIPASHGLPVVFNVRTVVNFQTVLAGNGHPVAHHNTVGRAVQIQRSVALVVLFDRPFRLAIEITSYRQVVDIEDPRLRSTPRETDPGECPNPGHGKGRMGCVCRAGRRSYGDLKLLFLGSVQLERHFDVMPHARLSHANPDTVDPDPRLGYAQRTEGPPCGIAHNQIKYAGSFPIQQHVAGNRDHARIHSGVHVGTRVVDKVRDGIGSNALACRLRQLADIEEIVVTHAYKLPHLIIPGIANALRGHALAESTPQRVELPALANAQTERAVLILDVLDLEVENRLLVEMLPPEAAAGRVGGREPGRALAFSGNLHDGFREDIQQYCRGFDSFISTDTTPYQKG